MAGPHVERLLDAEVDLVLVREAPGPDGFDVDRDVRDGPAAGEANLARPGIPAAVLVGGRRADLERQHVHAGDFPGPFPLPIRREDLPVRVVWPALDVSIELASRGTHLNRHVT